MKALIFGASILAASPAFAESTASSSSDPCEWVSTIAESIMKARQDEKPMAKVMAVFENGDAAPPVKKLMKQMVIEAYEERAMSAPENKAKAVARFQNEMYLSCVKGT